MITIINDINSEKRVSSSYVDSNSIGDTFNEKLGVLRGNGYRVISLEETAILRMIEGINWNCFNLSKPRYPSISGEDCTTQEAFVYVPNKGLFLTKNSPILENPKEATESIRYENEYYLTDEQIEKALVDSVKISDKVRRFWQTSIPTKKFAESEIASYAFGGSAEHYGMFLWNAGINLMPIYWTRQLYDEKPFARQVTFSQLYVPVIEGIGGYSGLNGMYQGIYNLRGINIEQSDSILGRIWDRYFPTLFERYLNLPKNDIKSGKNPKLNEDKYPEISRLSEVFDLSLGEERKLERAYRNLLANWKSE